MQSPLQKLAVHLLAASSVPIAVFAALAGLWMLSGWFGPVEFERVMIRDVVRCGGLASTPISSEPAASGITGRAASVGVSCRSP